jgi:hypothetical protein|nr:MAG TPA: hypothetical protein [Caudoviricetes sp.]
MNTKNPMKKVDEIYKAAIEINDLSEKAGFAMSRCLEERLNPVEMVEQVKKAKGYFEQMLTEMLAFEVRDFDALMKAIKAVENPES